jgi:dethiobiotin synthetase
LAVAGLKPVETGIAPGQASASDAGQLEAVSFHVKHPQPHPLYAFAAPIAPARAARATGVRIQCHPILQWVESTRGLDGTLPHLVVETAGGAFSPINDAESNFDLARQLGPAVWVLVAPDRLGVLHDVASSLQAMASMGRTPDCLVLSAPAVADPSTGANSEELQRRHPGLVILEASRDGAPEELAQLLSAAPRSQATSGT